MEKRAAFSLVTCFDIDRIGNRLQVLAKRNGTSAAKSMTTSD